MVEYFFSKGIRKFTQKGLLHKCFDVIFPNFLEEISVQCFIIPKNLLVLPSKWEN